MNDRHDQKKQPKGNHLRLCQRLAELEGEAGQLEIDADKLPEEVQPCTLAEAINDGLAMIDENMRIIFANNRFCEIIGYSRNEVIGHSASDFLTEADKKIVTEQVARRKTGKRDPYELAWIRKDGQKSFVLMSPRPIFAPDGSFKGSIAVVTDITDRIRAEEKLLNTTQKLEVRVQERTADLESVNKGLESEIAERKQVEKELRESEQRYSSLFKNNHSVMLLIDPESADIVEANPAACSFYGWSQEELTSMKITDINMLRTSRLFRKLSKPSPNRAIIFSSVTVWRMKKSVMLKYTVGRSDYMAKSFYIPSFMTSASASELSRNYVSPRTCSKKYLKVSGMLFSFWTPQSQLESQTVTQPPQRCSATIARRCWAIQQISCTWMNHHYESFKSSSIPP